MEWINTKTMVDLDELKAKMDISISDEAIEEMVNAHVESYVDTTLDEKELCDEDQVRDIVSDYVNDLGVLGSYEIEELISDAYVELESMIEALEGPDADEFDRVSGLVQNEILELRNQVEIARRSINMLLVERERSLSCRMANLLVTARRRTLFTLTAPQRWICQLLKKIKESL